MTPAKALRLAVALEEGERDIVGVWADPYECYSDVATITETKAAMLEAAKFLRAYANESIATMVAREENT